MKLFESVESNARYYSRRWPTVFATAHGSTLFDEHGRPFLDFFAGAGSLNYGHNPQPLVDALVRYMQSGGVLNSLDMATVAKREFIAAFVDGILKPRGLQYRLQFTGPTGSDVVEAALQLACKATGRHRVVCLTGAYHGATLFASMVSDGAARAEFEVSPVGVIRVPHEHDATPLRDPESLLAEAFQTSPYGPPAAASSGSQKPP